ncbi:MAG: glutaredoxin family protein [Candidatus Gracilibacteria bacterium]|nr:glutaredoxin family protein [Candidatus Gracilibacteria bacterium]
MEVKTIEIYSTTTCGFCTMLKSYLDGKKVTYTQYDLSKKPEKVTEMMEVSGQGGVPVTVLNRGKSDEVVVVGFNKPRIDELLGLS